MTLEVLTWLIAIPLLGFITGMRSMTPIAVLCWFGWLRLLPLDPWATWAGKLPVALGFTLLAAIEYAADKYGHSPRPTRPAFLLLRVFLGGLIGAIIATSLDAPTSEGIILGLLGALVGAFVAYELRHQLTRRLGCKVWHITVAEDIFAVVAAIVCMGIVTG